MGPIDALGHLVNLFLPALALAALAAALAKGLWRRALAPVRWRSLALPAALVNAGIVLAALWITGRDGTMAMYAAMVAGCAFTLWWQGFGPGRK